ncbi:MAG: hypothetical protein D6704_06275 [Nitrospirae bacterium]|nr:MAG: hypothetical protein D6704_06275 [Nitrospirota bacterium]
MVTRQREDVCCERLQHREILVTPSKFPLFKKGSDKMGVARVVGWFLGILLVIASGVSNGASWIFITVQTHAPFYSPAKATAFADQPIQWQNRSRMIHTVTADGCRRGGYCVFDSGPIRPGAHYTISALPSGVYPYHCSIHPFMQGVLVVKPARLDAVASLGFRSAGQEGL